MGENTVTSSNFSGYLTNFGQTKGSCISQEEVKKFILNLKKDKVTRLRKMQNIEQKQKMDLEAKNWETQKLVDQLKQESRDKKKIQHLEFAQKVTSC